VYSPAGLNLFQIAEVAATAIRRGFAEARTGGIRDAASREKLPHESTPGTAGW